MLSHDGAENECGVCCDPGFSHPPGLNEGDTQSGDLRESLETPLPQSQPQTKGFLCSRATS